MTYSLAVSLVSSVGGRCDKSRGTVSRFKCHSVFLCGQMFHWSRFVRHILNVSLFPLPLSLRFTMFPLGRLQYYDWYLRLLILMECFMSGVVDSLNRFKCIIDQPFNSLDCKVVKGNNKKLWLRHLVLQVYLCTPSNITYGFFFFFFSSLLSYLYHWQSNEFYSRENCCVHAEAEKQNFSPCILHLEDTGTRLKPIVPHR